MIGTNRKDSQNRSGNKTAVQHGAPMMPCWGAPGAGACPANRAEADSIIEPRSIRVILGELAGEVRQRQRQKQVVEAASSKPDPLKGLPVFPKSPINLWWKCPWREFSIQTNVQKTSRWRFKKQHLEREHGQQNLKLPTGNLLENPVRFANAKPTFQKRWESFHHVFQQLGWKGAHDIPLENVYCRVYTNKRGMPVQVPIHQCVACSRHVSRPSLATSVCPKVAGSRHLLPKGNEFGSSVAKEHCLNQARVTQARQSARNCRGGGSSRSPGVKKEWRHEQQ